MSAGLSYNKYDKGGLCYAACQEAFEWYHILLWYYFIGGMPQPSGARRDVILEEAVKVTPFSGKPLLNQWIAPW
jgi:hypothetical protein